MVFAMLFFGIVPIIILVFFLILAWDAYKDFRK